MTLGTRVNLFLIYSPLHYLAAERIAATFEVGAQNCLYYLKPNSERIIERERWKVVEFLPWPRFFPFPGLFGRARRTLDNLNRLASVCSDATEIVLHTPVIDTEAVNYAINGLRTRFPSARFAVRLLPDGLMNVMRHPQPLIKRLIQHLRQGQRLFWPELNYYSFAGDRTGSDDPIVERIYHLPGLPHEYDARKVVVLPSLSEATTEGLDTRAAGTALVVGQPLVVWKRMTPANVARVTETIHSLLQREGFLNIFYKAHPRDKEREYSHPDYSELQIEQPLETYLARNPCGMVIGVCSTALLTARLILPPESRVIACGMNLMQFKSEEERNTLVLPFMKAGIELHDA